MFYDPRSEPYELPHNPRTALITPRPIGWVSSRSPGGQDNLAPYSFFNAISGVPPFLMFSSTPRKNTLENIEASGVFVANVATGGPAEAVVASSAAFPAEVDESRRPV